MNAARLRRMECDDETLARTVDRSMLRRLRWRDDEGPGRRDAIWTPFHHAQVDDTQLLLSPRGRIDDTRRTQWLPEILELARTHGSATIRCLTSHRLTPGHHERAMLERGFTVEVEGHVLGTALDALPVRTPQRLVEVTGSGRSLAAAFRVSAALWGTPPMGPEVAAVVAEALADIPLEERSKHDVVVWLNHQPAAIARLMVDGDVGMLEAGATLPEYRHLGAYTATVDARLALARNVGCRRVLAHTEDAHAEKVLVSRGLEIIDTTRLYTLTLRP